MESQIAPHHHHPHAHQHRPHDAGLHQSVEGEEDHEKKSVLKKVKAKAKKIKDTVTKHGHGHDHDDDDGDEGMLEDPQLQGAPLYEGAAMRSAVAPTPQGEHRHVGLGRSTVQHDQTPPAPRETTSRSAVDAGFGTKEREVDNSAVAPNTTMSLSPWSLEEDPHAPKQPHAPRHSEVKASDPAAIGNQEAGASSQILDSFAKMNVNDELRANRNLAKLEAAGDQSSYAQKISAVGSAVAGTAVSAKDFVASKLGYGEDKGLSVKEYLAQKLEPGDDDRALSEAISEAFHKPKPRVTESEELTRRLGRDDNREAERSSTAAWVKDTVGSWMGKAGDSPTSHSQHSPGSSQGSMDSAAAGEGRRRQEGPGGTEAEVRIL